MRPSVRAEKYIRDASGAEKTLPIATITGRTDRRTDRPDRQTECDAICGPLLGRRGPPPREEGRITTLWTRCDGHISWG